MRHGSCAWAIWQILTRNAYAVHVPLLEPCLKLQKLGVEWIMSCEFIQLWHLCNSIGSSSFTFSPPTVASLSRELCLGVPGVEMITGLNTSQSCRKDTPYCRDKFQGYTWEELLNKPSLSLSILRKMSQQGVRKADHLILWLKEHRSTTWWKNFKMRLPMPLICYFFFHLITQPKDCQ